jgi:hypothetical protein
MINSVLDFSPRTIHKNEFFCFVCCFEK